MLDREVALEALSTICNARVTSVQRERSHASLQAVAGAGPFQQLFNAAVNPLGLLLSTAALIPTVLQTETSGGTEPRTVKLERDLGKDTSGQLYIDEDHFFDPHFDCDFTSLTDTETYYRGGEVYERPCGWYRFAIKVLNKYDDNTWLGTRYRSTESVPGEWPVSYHGTSQEGAGGILKRNYKAGPRQRYGRGIYSTPYIAEAVGYTSTFTSKKTGKTYRVILQNRINPKYREKCKDDKYWLVRIPEGTSDKEEEELVGKAIRPYGLLLKEV